MLFAKITPSVKLVDPESSRINPIFLEANYASAVALNYHIGNDKVRFRVLFGEVKIDENGNAEGFKRLAGEDVILTESEIADWGTDDSVILTKLCEKLGIQAVEFISGNTANLLYS